MTQNTITLIVLAVLVVFSLPALYRKKKSGDLTLWGKGRNILGQLPSEEAACAAVSSSSRNGSQKDILQFVSSLMKLVRKNHWYIVMPGQLSDGTTKTNLSLVLITQHRVIGLKCYGYGGALTNNGKAADWTQKLDKTTKAIHSPLPDQTAQQAALASLLPQLNASQVEVFSVFTTPGVQLINCSGLNCFTSVSLLEKLQSSSADCTGTLQPKELGAAICAVAVQAKTPSQLFHFSCKGVFVLLFIITRSRYFPAAVRFAPPGSPRRSCGRLSSGFSVVTGSGAMVSSPAPAILPLHRALARAALATRSPRAVLTMKMHRPSCPPENLRPPCSRSEV